MVSVLVNKNQLKLERDGVSKRIDGLIPRGIIKKHKGPSKTLKTYSRELIQVSQGEINQYGFLLNDGLCRLLSG